MATVTLRIMQTYRLSPSSLNIFLECPKCFWLQLKKGLKRPETPFSTLPRAMDLLIKKYFDKWRPNKLPPELQDRFSGELIQEQQLLDTWRNWKQGLRYADAALGNSVLLGLLDECFVQGDIYIPADYKTRGFDLKDDSASYYQNQLDCYTLLLEKNNYKVNNTAYLIYYILDSLEENGAGKFKVELIEVKTEPKRAYATFKKAIETLEGPTPAKGESCTFCAWVSNSNHTQARLF